MQLAFLSLALITVHVCVTVDCRPRRRRPTAAGFKPAARMESFYPERNESMGSPFHRGLLVVFPATKAANSLVSIYDLRKKRFLCVDVNGELYKSRRKDRRDCLFQQTPRDAFYSTSGNWLLELGGGDLRAAHRGPAVKRQRRSEEVNPADPLQTVSHPSPPTKDGTAGQPEQDQTGAVSKETLSSCDDPLRVLQPNGPGSPVKTNIADRPEHQ